MRDNEARIRGRVATDRQGFSFDGYIVQVRRAGEDLGRADVAPDGRFSVHVAEHQHADGQLVHVTLVAPWGGRVGERRLLMEGATRPPETVFRAPIASILGVNPAVEVVAPPPEQVVSEDALRRFYRAVSVAAESGSFAGHFGPLEATGWIHFYADELEQLQQLSRSLATGALSGLSALRELTVDAPRLPSGAGAGHPHGEDVNGFVATHAPVEIVAAGLMMELLLGRAGDWPERAAGFYLQRIDAINRAFGAAERLLAGKLDHREFARLVEAAGPAHDGHGGNVHGPGDGAGRSPQAGEAPSDPDLDHLDERSQALEHCLGQLVEAGRSVVGRQDIPFLVARTDPSAVRQAFDGVVRLHPVAGTSFPPDDDSVRRRLAIWDGRRRHQLAVAVWTPQAIDVRLPMGIDAGHIGVLCELSETSLSERLADIVSEDRSCLPFLIGGPVGPARPPGQAVLRVVSGPAVRLTADSQEDELRAEAGADVVLEWQVNTVAEAGDIRTRLLADGVVADTTVSRSGRLVVSQARTRSYVLEADLTVNGEPGGQASARVTVIRRRRISVSVSDRIYRPTEPLAVSVSVEYPDPAHDMVVDLRSSDGDVVPDGEALILAGMTGTVIALRAGATEGTATLTARLRPRDGEEAESCEVKVQVGRTSCTDPRYGGSWEPVRLNVVEPADPCPPATALRAAGSRQLGYAGARLTDAGSSLTSIPDCWSETAAAIQTCSDTETREQAACDSAHAARLASCASIQCTGFTNCASIGCNSFTNCNDFWASDPRRYMCYLARAACVVAAAVAQGACWVARGACVAAATVARGLCIGGSAVVLGVCKAAAWTKSVACKAVAAAAVAVCVVVKVVVAVVNVVVAIGHILVGATLNTAGAVVAGVCAAGRLVGVNVGTPATTSNRLRVVGIHLAVLHTGKVLIFSYDEGNVPVTRTNPADPAAVGDSDRALCALWDPATGSARYLPLARNLFCSGHCFAADGKLFVAGGQFPLPGLLKSLIPPRELAPGADRDLHLFDPVVEAWTRMDKDMEKGRWYPTCVTAPDGNVMVASGTNGYATQQAFGRGIQHTWKMVNPATGEVGPDQGFNKQPIFHNYPFMHTVPNGEIFIHYKKITRFFRSPGGWSLMRKGGATGGAYGGAEGDPEVTRYEFSRTGPGPGTSVLLPLVPTGRSADGGVKYPAGRILILGGGGAEAPGEPKLDEEYNLSPTTPATNTAEILDLEEQPRRWRYTGRVATRPNEPDEKTSPMAYARVMPDTVLLPNAKVLVVNGAQTGQSGGFLSHMRGVGGNPSMGATDPAQYPELFDPELETWETLCPKTVERLYHATAVLLPDARVLVAGHDGFLNMAPHDASQYDLEVFSPPYLHRGPRPRITSAPAEVIYGAVFSIATPDALTIQSVCLIRQSSTTHQINTDQRYVGLAMAPTGPQNTLVVQAPPDGGVAPPGFYMLFILNREGVPSVATWMKLSSAAKLDGDGR